MKEEPSHKSSTYFFVVGFLFFLAEAAVPPLTEMLRLLGGEGVGVLGLNREVALLLLLLL